jgi:hypothetical protein
MIKYEKLNLYEWSCFILRRKQETGNPTAGQSVDDTGILSCVQTFGYMLLFAAIGVVTLTFTTILLCICVPNEASSLVGK